ncbi:MAG: hypothetical protein A2Y78_02160 [Acidobacteria bacterium RBG_13_68_16]|jgi:hypothetical protein|nr:MAG: hypothetical protein A2Y78_02160 [Acidobacteria bacterium RBG_13_68_16]
MKKLTDREIRRLLSVRGTLEPPDGLPGRIKAEIPDVLHVGAAGLEPERSRMIPPVAGVRSLWLIAASLLVVIGAGFVVLRLLGPSEDLARRIALEGVTVVKDVVVSVPERSTVERQKLASAMTMAKSTTKRERQKGPQSTKPAAKVESATTTQVQPPADAEAGDTVVAVVVGATEQMAGVVPQGRATDEGATVDRPVTSRMARPAAVADKMDVAAAPLQAVSGSIIVVVQDSSGKPVVGAVVRLDLYDRPDVNCGSRTTGVGGAATFCCVEPGTYRVCARLPGFLAAAARVVVTPGAQLNVPLAMERPPADGEEHPWPCPTPEPPAPR